MPKKKDEFSCRYLFEGDKCWNDKVGLKCVGEGCEHREEPRLSTRKTVTVKKPAPKPKKAKPKAKPKKKKTKPKPEPEPEEVQEVPEPHDVDEVTEPAEVPEETEQVEETEPTVEKEKPERKRPTVLETRIVVDETGRHKFENPTDVEIQVFRVFDTSAEDGMRFKYRRMRVCTLTIKKIDDRELDEPIIRQGKGWSRWYPYPEKRIFRAEPKQ